MPKSDDDRNSRVAQIVALVGPGKRVLGIGGDQDALWKELRQVSAAVVVADPARLTERAGDDRFDDVVCADALGALDDPAGLLRTAATLLTSGGRVVISSPNVAHGSFRLAVLQGQGRPDGALAGLGTRQGLIDLIASAGLQCDDLRAVVRDPLDLDIVLDDDLPSGIVEWVRNQPDALFSEFVAAASPVPAGAEPAHVQRVTPAANPDEVRRQDEHTDAAVSAQREALVMRDLIVGLQAEAATAFVRAERQTARRKNLEVRLAKQVDDVDSLKRRVAQLERQGFVGFLRRAKRKLGS